MLNSYYECLPDVLSKEELLCNLKEYREGNIQARGNIIIHNIKLVIKLVNRKYGYENPNYDEFIQIGIVGLIKSIDTFDLDKDYEFSTYAWRCIENEILMHLRKERQFNKKNKSINEESSEEILSDVDLVYNYEDKELYSELRNVIDTLNDREKEIVLLYFGFINNREYKQKDIAVMYNVTPSYISKVVKNALIKIKYNLENKQLKRIK